MKNNFISYVILIWLFFSCSITGNASLRDKDALFFIDVSEPSGITSIYERSRFDTYPYGSGIVVLDYDNDGHDDVFYADRTGLDLLYRNQADGTFIDVAVAALNPFVLPNKSQ